MLIQVFWIGAGLVLLVAGADALVRGASRLALAFGVSALVAPGELTVTPSVLAFDLPVMTAVAVACLPVFFTGRTIARWEGLVFLGYYVAYTAYLILATQRHESTEAFSDAMLGFVLPITLLTLVVSLSGELKARRN